MKDLEATPKQKVVFGSILSIQVKSLKSNVIKRLNYLSTGSIPALSKKGGTVPVEVDNGKFGVYMHAHPGFNRSPGCKYIHQAVCEQC